MKVISCQMEGPIQVNFQEPTVCATVNENKNILYCREYQYKKKRNISMMASKSSHIMNKKITEHVRSSCSIGQSYIDNPTYLMKN